MREEFSNIATPWLTTGLRCRWVASEDDNGTHLTARWSDDRPELREAAICADARLGPKGGELC